MYDGWSSDVPIGIIPATGEMNTGSVAGGGYIGGIVGYHGNSSISNCYATGEIRGNTGVGGLVGWNSGSCVLNNCAALNPSIPNGGYIGRVVGSGSGSNNIAWSGMTLIGSTVSSSDGASGHGADITTEEIKADGTLGGRFTTANGWTIVNGKLPGFGAAEELPEHLK